MAHIMDRWIKRSLLVVCLALTLWGAPTLSQPLARPGGAPPPGSGPLVIEGFVRAALGDTIDARTPYGRALIGVIGIQAPRTSTGCGRAATEFLQDLVSGGVRLDEGHGSTFDSRSRRMYHVTSLDGRSVAAEMIAAGFAVADSRGTDDDHLLHLQEAARVARRGCVWSAAGAP
jgi:endonuclease YncB( thermonuclease family)